jgi:four helix bundle protein
VRQLSVVVSVAERKDSLSVALNRSGVWNRWRETVGMQDFRRLLVWGRAHELVLGVRRGIRQFPRSERGSLKSQITNAAESIAFNIVEGCGARTSKEFARFLDISVKSTSELEYQLQLATDAGLLPRYVSQPLATETVEIRRMLCGLRRKVLRQTRPRTDLPLTTTDQLPTQD